MDPIALPPETLEGWYVLHQVFTLDRAALRDAAPDARVRALDEARGALEALVAPGGSTAAGWSAVVRLVGSTADVLLVHLRPTLAELGVVEREVKALALARYLRPVTSFLSVTEAGLYHLTAQLAREAADRGGRAGDDAYRAALAERSGAERESAMVKRRLEPQRPATMPWVCFYPMSKRRAAGQNWYALTLEERSRLMHTHGLTGRRYAGRVLQIISGAIGFDAWEWGVTLFAADPLDFKKLVTDMRFDEVSAQYAEFGEFWVGEVVEPTDWVATLA